MATYKNNVTTITTSGSSSNQAILESKSTKVLPSNPSDRGWSASLIQKKTYEATLYVFSLLATFNAEVLTTFTGYEDNLDTIFSSIGVLNDTTVPNAKAEAISTSETYAAQIVAAEATLREQGDSATLTSAQNYTNTVRDTITSNYTFEAPYIHQMGSGDDAVPNTRYVLDQIETAIDEATKEHIEDITASEDSLTGVITITLKRNGDSDLKCQFNTPDKNILSDTSPQLIVTDEGKRVIRLYFVNNTKVDVDVSPLYNIYSGVTNNYITVTVSDNNEIEAILDTSFQTTLEDAKVKEGQRQTNENTRIATYEKYFGEDGTSGIIPTLSDEIDAKMEEYKSVNDSALKIVNNANAILETLGIAEEESY